MNSTSITISFCVIYFLGKQIATPININAKITFKLPFFFETIGSIEKSKFLMERFATFLQGIYAPAIATNIVMQIGKINCTVVK